jgi:GT2 family glycosyltransferase
MTKSAGLPAIAVITVNWKGFDHTRRFVECVRSSTIRPAQLIVVNNDSDETEKIDSLRGGGVTVLHSGGNIGYAEALNRGIIFAREAGADTFLLMNNDTTFERDFIAAMASGGGKNVIASPVILYSAGDTVQNTGGKLSILLGGGYNLNKGVPVNRAKKVPPHFLSGCCLYLHRDVIDRVGLFDATYHSYCEDADFCLRAVREGVSLEVRWDLVIWHHHSASTAGDKGHKVRLLARNPIILAKKTLRPPAREIFIAACVVRGFFQHLGRRSFSSYLTGTREGLTF